MIISSQKFIDEEIVQEKLEAEDFTVTLATIEANGETYQILIDGHHSFEAAKRAGVKPIYQEAEYNYQAEVDYLGFDRFLEAHWVDSEWYDVETGNGVWD